MDQPTSDRAEELYRPPLERTESSRLASFIGHVNSEHELTLSSYQALHRWSVDDVGRFWTEIIRYFDIPYVGQLEPAVEGEMPDAHWFANVHLNYTACIFANMNAQRAQRIALVVADETSQVSELRFGDLLGAVSCVRQQLAALGVEPGDRVCGYLTNAAEAVVALLATASLGGIWSSCPPEFGSDSVLERFSQIAPKVLFAVDGYRYAGKQFDRQAEVQALIDGLTTLQAVVMVSDDERLAIAHKSDLTLCRMLFKGEKLCFWRGAQPTWSSFLDALDFEPTPVAFESPLWILYSSGTTGKPKAIVHGHGGIVLEHVKVLALQSDLGPQDRFFWYSTTGWMMWNYLVGGLLVDAQVVLYDGSPTHPGIGRLWELADKLNVTYFGASAPFYMHCRAAGFVPKAACDLSSVRAVGSTGAPLPIEGYHWVYESVKGDVSLESVSGGTDVCTAFLCGSPLSAVRAGELSCKALAADVQALDAEGCAVTDQVGELAICQPLPSMPIAFWGDDDGQRRYASYFARFEGVWCHGDWIRCYADDASVIYGRSDATLNRGGVRMGTSEFYRVIEGKLGVAQSLVVDTSELGVRGKLWLFVVLAADAEAASAEGALKSLIRQRLSPRHVPDEIRFVSELPITLSGKKLEVPIKRLIQRHASGNLPDGPSRLTEQGHGIQLGTLRNPRSVVELITVLNAP